MDPNDGSSLTKTYLGVIAVEAAILAALWLVGRMFS